MIDKLFIFLFKVQRYLFARYVAKKKKNNPEVIRQYLMTEHYTRQPFIFNYSQSFFNGLHPKNVFNFRNEFFLENVNHDDIVIDIGCGTGLILNKISEKIKKGIGIDYSENNITTCQKLHAKSNLEFMQADMFQFNYKELRNKTGYSKVIFSHVIEHVKDVPSLLKLVDANCLLICVPSQENWYTQFKKHLGLPYLTDPTHFREYTREMLIDELRQAGYSSTYIGFNSEGEIICRAVK